MAGARRRILVVEDDSETAEQLMETLTTSGCNEARRPENCEVMGCRNGHGGRLGPFLSKFRHDGNEGRRRPMGVHHQTVQRCVERALACGPMVPLDDRRGPAGSRRSQPQPMHGCKAIPHRPSGLCPVAVGGRRCRLLD
jgi:hypothetical protein